MDPSGMIPSHQVATQLAPLKICSDRPAGSKNHKVTCGIWELFEWHMILRQKSKLAQEIAGNSPDFQKNWVNAAGISQKIAGKESSLAQKQQKNSENFKVPEIRHICHSNPIQMIFSFPTIKIYKQSSRFLPKIRFHLRPGLKERKVEFQNQFFTIVGI